MTKDQIVDKFKAYVAHKLPDAKNIDFGHFIPIFGGGSRQTFRVELNYTMDGEQTSRPIILRREFSSGIIETNTRTEWEAYRAYCGTKVPVPKLIWLEENSKWLDTPFFVMDEIVDCQSSIQLFNEAGEIKAVLDWEMMHMGDPLEDLAWSMNRLWTWSEPDLIGLMIPREKGIKIWEETSGFSAKPLSLFWWEVFTSVKSMAVWISMNRVYATGGTRI